MYTEMSFSGSSDSRCSSWATIRLAIWSSTGVPRKMIRSFSRRLYMSNARSPREVCSTTIGTSGLIVLALVSLRRADSSTRLARRGVIGGGPEPVRRRRGRRLLGPLLPGGPQPLPGLRLAHRYRLGPRRDQLDGLARRLLLAQVLQAAGRAQLLEQRRGLDALVFGGWRHRAQQLLVGDRYPLRRHDRREHRLPAQRLLGLGLQVGQRLGLAAPRDLRIALGRDAAARQRAQHSLPHLARPGLDQLGRHADPGPGHHRIERGLAELALDARPLELQQARADLLAQLLHAVEAGVDREVLVDRRKLLGLDLLDGHLERRLAPGQLNVVVARRKRDLHRARLASLGPEQALLEALDQVATAELHQLVAAVAARQALPPASAAAARAAGREPAAVVHHQEVALGCRARRRLQARQPLTYQLDLPLDQLVLHDRLAARHLQLVEAAQLGFRHDADLDRELECLALGRQRAEVQLRVADRDDARAVDRCRIPARQRVADRLLQHRLASDPLDHQRRRHLSAPEARQLQLASELPRLALDAPLELARRHLHLHPHARVRELRDGGLHALLLEAPDTSATIPCRRMSAGSRQRPGRRLETWLWTGPLGHLLGGAADLAAALCGYGFRR